MTDHLYTTTPQIEQARALWEQGVLLAEIKKGFYTKKLYQLQADYFEVTWHNHFNVAIKVSRFTDTDSLTPYLDGISLDGLFT